MSPDGFRFLFCAECKRKEVERIIAGQQYGINAALARK